jgi:Mlc titration factor MtfA (ptsG expression regulator)
MGNTMLGLRKRRRKRLMAKSFPEKWKAMIARNVPYYRCLSSQDQSKLHALIQVFLAEKHFEGCGGLEITDEMRVTIAAQACILLLGDTSDFYPRLYSILVYPSTFIARIHKHQSDGTVLEGIQPRLGESWSSGALVLSWDEVLQGASDIHDGHNLVYHEFAHQLDIESGAAEGAPKLPKPSMYIGWARVLTKEYEALVKAVADHRPSLLDQYGAVNPAEFFAVATEFFFERPIDLKRLHPDLYAQLKLFYRRDPAQMFENCRF